MGGGGPMFAAAAAKLAGICRIRGGIIGASVPEEQSVRNPSRQVSTVLSASGAGVAADVAPVKATCLVALPRVVFGGVPTLEEAKDATTDLKVALEKVYLMPTYTGSSGSIGSNLFCKTKVATVPQVAMKAFRMINEIPEVQSVVASIAIDPKVWNAVMQNGALIEFLQNQKTNGESHASESNKNVEAEEVLDQESPVKCPDALEESQPGNFKTMMMDAFKRIRAKVVNMVGSITSILQDIFDIPSGENIFDIPSGENNSENGPTVTEKTMAAMFVGLAVMVVMLVILKRPMVVALKCI